MLKSGTSSAQTGVAPKHKQIITPHLKKYVSRPGETDKAKSPLTYFVHPDTDCSGKINTPFSNLFCAKSEALDKDFFYCHGVTAGNIMRL